MAAQIVPTAAAWKSEGGGAIAGTVAFVSPQVEPRNGSVMVGIDLPPEAGLRPGLTVKVRIIAEEHKDCLVVPRAAVVADENGDNVIAVVEGEQATHKSVKIGLEENGLIEIKAEGLEAGTTVATAGAYGLPAATHVKVVN
jgi:multidrug efflux pump subunit AcrA (membrane-fusion protein)